MLTVVQIRALKPAKRPYKVADANCDAGAVRQLGRGWTRGRMIALNQCCRFAHRPASPAR